MKKYINALFIAALAVVTFTACSSDDEDYTPAEPATGQQVYFSNELAEKVNISTEESSFTVVVNRIKTDEALTVALTATDEDDFFNIPESVSFEAGEATADIVISYNPEAVEYNVFHNVTLSIDDESVTTPYGKTAYTFAAGAAYTFTSLGTGTFNDSFFFDEKFPVAIVQNDQNPNVYRVMNPYGTGGLAQAVENGYLAGEPAPAEYLEFEIMKPGTVLYDIEITRSDLVLYDATSTGLMHPSYADNGSIHLLHPSNFSAFTSEDFLNYNRVTEYFDDGTPAQIQLAPYYYMYGLGGFNYSQDADQITINMPGFSPKDYTLEGEYMGRLTAVDDTDYAQVSVTVGADLETVKYAVTTGSVDELIDAIVDGTAEDVAEIPSSGTISIPLEETGTYRVALVGYAEGEAVTATDVTVRFTSSHDNQATFSEVGTGTYLYDAEGFFEGDDPGLVISKSDANDGTYKISHWGYDVDFVFTWNENTNEVTVPEQFTGYTHSTYGDVYVSDVPTYDPEESTYEEYPCYYDPDKATFHFTLIYYVSAGVFGVGAETFTVEWDAQAKAVKGIKKSYGFQLGKSLKPVKMKNTKLSKAKKNFTRVNTVR